MTCRPVVTVAKARKISRWSKPRAYPDEGVRAIARLFCSYPRLPMAAQSVNRKACGMRGPGLGSSTGGGGGVRFMGPSPLFDEDGVTPGCFNRMSPPVSVVAATITPRATTSASTSTKHLASGSPSCMVKLDDRASGYQGERSAVCVTSVSGTDAIPTWAPT